MKDLIVKTSAASPFNPSVEFNGASGDCVIGGESFMDNAYEFYAPLLEWLTDFCIDTSRHVSLTIRLTYFNTSSSRYLLEILDVLAVFQDKGGVIDVVWYCYDDDPDMRDEIEDLEEETGLAIQIEEIPRPVDHA